MALQGICLPYSLGRFQDLPKTSTDSITKPTADSTLIEVLPLSLEDSVRLIVDSIMMAESDTFPIIKMSLMPDSIQTYYDSIARAAFVKDSIIQAKIAFQHWFDSLPKREQRIWYRENVIIPAKMHRSDSILAAKDSIRAYKDSVIEATPRILETPFIPDSLWYKRILHMTQDKNFGDFRIEKYDTSYNRNFYDYRFFHEDVNATWLGTAGSPVQKYNITKQDKEDNVIFFGHLHPWTSTPQTIATYNTKTPYTELAYWGNLIADSKKEELNIRFLSTQNITPKLNVTIELNNYRTGGALNKDENTFKNIALSANYLGTRYSMHAGFIYDKSERTENGGIQDNMWIRDTVVDAKEIAVNLAEAKSKLTRTTLFLNQNLRIPLGRDSSSTTTAFVGHSTEWSIFNRYYSDKTDASLKSFYNNNFFINPTKSADSLHVMRLDNKFYIRLQPWKDDSAVSKLDAGIGDKLLKYFDHSPMMYLNGKGGTLQNNVYVYGGAKGMIRQTFDWRANAQFTFLGPEAGDLNVDAHAYFHFYPFRKHRKSPLSIGAHFLTDLKSPDHYEQHLWTNHYKWDNGFSKISTTRICGTVDIPAWGMNVDVAYSLLGNQLFYDNCGIIRQSGTPVNVLSAMLRKEFVLWKFHLDNRLLYQASSDQSVVPVPMFAANLRWFLQFDVVKNVMQMQIGANVLFNTKWNMPAYNPALGVFYNQNSYEYGLCPIADVFVNIQWKRAQIFIKGENLNQGWPLKQGSFDYFTAHNYIHTQRGLKFGLHWPFYVQPMKTHTHDHDHDHGHKGSQNSAPSTSGHSTRAANLPSGRAKL